MSGKIFERDYFIHIYETGPDKKLEVPALMRYFEEVALLQSEQQGIGFDYYEKNKVAWMLHQFDIRFSRYPEFGEKVTIRTQPWSVFRFFGFRKYWVLDRDGCELITADTSWLFVNTLNKRPMRVNDDMKRGYGHLENPEERLPMPEMDAPQRTDHAKEFQVRYADIDVNKHVNNTHYLEWALEALPAAIREDCMLQQVRIIFKKETTYGCRIQSLAQVEKTQTGFECLHRIATTDGTERSLLMTRWAVL